MNIIDRLIAGDLSGSGGPYVRVEAFDRDDSPRRRAELFEMEIEREQSLAHFSGDTT